MLALIDKKSSPYSPRIRKLRELALKSERVHIGLLILKPEDAARFPECFVECTQIPKKKKNKLGKANQKIGAKKNACRFDR